jgi:hypothetical protein
MASKILYIYDGESNQQEDLIHFCESIQGYQVVSQKIVDDDFDSAQEFITQFQAQVTAARPYVLAIFHYSKGGNSGSSGSSGDNNHNSEPTTTCTYCNRPGHNHSRLLKHALACSYLKWGSARCVVIHPPYCCTLNSTMLPQKQVEEMAIPYAPTDAFWESLTERFERVRAFDKHSEKTCHVRTTTTVATAVAAAVATEGGASSESTTPQQVSHTRVEADTETPVSLEQVLHQVAIAVSQAPDTEIEPFVKRFAVGKIEWRELRDQEGVIAALDRILKKKAPLGDPFAAGWERNTLENCKGYLQNSEQYAEYVRLIQDFIDFNIRSNECEGALPKGPLPLLSGYQLRTENLKQKGDADDQFLGGMNPHIKRMGPTGTGGKNIGTPYGGGAVGDDGLEGVPLSLLPPYLRDAMELKNSEKATEITQEFIERAQKMDAEFEKRKLARDMKEYRGEFPLGSNLMNGFSMKDKVEKGEGAKCLF